MEILLKWGLKPLPSLKLKIKVRRRYIVELILEVEASSTLSSWRREIYQKEYHKSIFSNTNICLTTAF